MIQGSDRDTLFDPRSAIHYHSQAPLRLIDEHKPPAIASLAHQPPPPPRIRMFKKGYELQAQKRQQQAKPIDVMTNNDDEVVSKASVKSVRKNSAWKKRESSSDYEPVSSSIIRSKLKKRKGKKLPMQKQDRSSSSPRVLSTRIAAAKFSAPRQTREPCEGSTNRKGLATGDAPGPSNRHSRPKHETRANEQPVSKYLLLAPTAFARNHPCVGTFNSYHLSSLFRIFKIKFK